MASGRLQVPEPLALQAPWLPYVVFDHWSYLRFLLPTVPLIVVLMVAAVDAKVRIYRPDDRERYLHGTRPATEYVR
jgi:hypothetical protein